MNELKARKVLLKYRQTVVAVCGSAVGPTRLSSALGNTELKPFWGQHDW